jgi:hypothetical protein
MRTLTKRKEFLDRVDFVRRLNAPHVNYHGLIRDRHIAGQVQQHFSNPTTVGPGLAAREAQLARDIAHLTRDIASALPSFAAARGFAETGAPRTSFGVPRPQKAKKK